MNSATDPRTALREARALVLARFNLLDAQVMCGDAASVMTAPELDDPCPACRTPGLRFTRTGQRAETIAERATHFTCAGCGAHGDAVTYVQLASGGARSWGVLKNIETWLDRQGR